MAKEAKVGLEISRIFTKEGVHPYDEVKWEKRDVVQTNWKSGEVVFEQKGVEFPEFWSQNATTIATTKYFRGTIGENNREWSLKQLIDRVAQTYTREGLKAGYFASKKDALVFEHELTWMLLHQVFAFNSPVWFNVGTKDSQQVSACFILSVDDTMDSILNWYREEGMIFKGGSGAGLNISKIRSSVETLSSGGTSSGPISFMRGADASAGTIKSGGATRRAAKMVVLDVDHPDVEDFIDLKAREEDKIRVLRDAGFDMDLGGKDIVSVQYQNANNSVRISDEFMSAYEKGAKFPLTARKDGRVVKEVDARELFGKIAKAAWECADPGVQYSSTINRWHTNPVTGPITASNPCSEYLSIDNSACNLASLNLMKFLKEDDTFDIETFEKVTEFVILAMDISVTFGDFPTEKITTNTRAYRQLGIGYANLGALLMATGHGYDSDGGRELAAAITSLMSATAYRRSAEIAEKLGAYEGYAINADAHQGVLRMHEKANEQLKIDGALAAEIRKAAGVQWAQGNELGQKVGWRNAQASLLAPTGCLVGDSLVTTDRGLARLSELGDVYGEKWQNLDANVSTDEGVRQATKFFVNGEEETRTIVTTRGYSIQGTPTHRIKVANPQTGVWEWKRFADIAAGDVVPLQLGVMIGEARSVPLPSADQAYYTNDAELDTPRFITPELAELVGYFMGDGSLHSKGLRFCVSNEDPDVVTHLKQLAKNLFNIEAKVYEKEGYQEVAFNSVRLVNWWEAAGFRKGSPAEGALSWMPHVPWSIRETNDPEIYAAFLRGVFEADGTVSLQVPVVSTAKKRFAEDLRSLLLAVGVPTTTRETVSGISGAPSYQIRVRNFNHTITFGEKVGFIGARKSQKMRAEASPLGGKHDNIVIDPNVLKELIPVGHPLRMKVSNAIARKIGVARLVAQEIYEATGDERIKAALGYIYEPVAANLDGGVQPTYDISVPSNVTYVANGFVSHNTIGFLMDVDTTGIEPDFALVKFKKLVGGGSLQIVNGTVTRALKRFGYNESQSAEIEAYIAEHGHVVGAPHLDPKYYEVFDCAMGAERYIKPMGHIKMMAAVQPFLSGAISKTVNLPESATVEDIEQVYYEGWKMGLKAIAVYRDNCKVGQPLSDAKAKKNTEAAPVAAPPVQIVNKPRRERLPRRRQSATTSYKVAGADGYLTASSYPDGRLGEVFLRLGKQGSTLAGVMDAFSIAVSIGLQYGVPLEAFVEKFTNMRFEPSGMTDDQDLRMAQSVVDYIFRRLALDYLPFEARSALSIYTSSERARQLETGEYTPDPSEEDFVTAQQSVSVHETREIRTEPEAKKEAHSSTELMELKIGRAADSPLCMNCGVKMRPSGSCYVCESCGNTSGCS